MNVEHFDNLFSADPGKLAAMTYPWLDGKQKSARKLPAMYEVVLMNDGTTPMEFVVVVLEDVFHKCEDDALDLTIDGRFEGDISCGLFTRDVAETKMIEVIDMARANGFALKCIMHKH